MWISWFEFWFFVSLMVAACVKVSLIEFAIDQGGTRNVNEQLGGWVFSWVCFLFGIGLWAVVQDLTWMNVYYTYGVLFMLGIIVGTPIAIGDGMKMARQYLLRRKKVKEEYEAKLQKWMKGKEAILKTSVEESSVDKLALISQHLQLIDTQKPEKPRWF